jgi:hypothetical protein
VVEEDRIVAEHDETTYLSHSITFHIHASAYAQFPFTFTFIFIQILKTIIN